jgi:hypothetical protein
MINLARQPYLTNDIKPTICSQFFWSNQGLFFTKEILTNWKEASIANCWSMTTFELNKQNRLIEIEVLLPIND